MRQKVDGKFTTDKIRLTTPKLIDQAELQFTGYGGTVTGYHNTRKMQSTKSSIWGNVQKMTTQSLQQINAMKKSERETHGLKEIKRPFWVLIPTCYLFFFFN